MKIGLEGTQVPNDGNNILSEANQEMINVTQTDNNIYVELEDGQTLNSYEFIDGIQGEGQWIALGIHTGLNDITKVKYDEQYLTAEDVTNASSVGLPAGSFLYWVKYEDLPQTFTLQADGFAVKTFTVETI